MTQPPDIPPHETDAKSAALEQEDLTLNGAPDDDAEDEEEAAPKAEPKPKKHQQDTGTFQKNVDSAQRAALANKAFEEHYDQKKLWSVWILGFIGLIVVSQIVLIWFIGFGWVDFTQYWDKFLPTLLAQNLAQVIGLGLIVVQSLFKQFDRDEKNHPPKKPPALGKMQSKAKSDPA